MKNLKPDRTQLPRFRLWIFSLILNLAFWLLLRLLPAEATYTLRGFWSISALPCLGLLT
ncbi:MAG: hypothetical protein RMX68_032735 [Aulosira sp. ZfuVER01]|nr:hypothetical protein [Aulosira sp. DedVER01a]MDZ8052946.1 hypothetical protein [Aulosira sp. ZfuCHP01]